MKPESLKLLFGSYIQCRQIQDECDSPGNLAGEFDDPVHPFKKLTGGSNEIGVEQGAVSSNAILAQIFYSGQEPNLPNNVIQVGRDLARISQEFSTSQPEKSIIKFKVICMVVEPVEQIISIIVMRDPKFSQAVTKVSWKTCDKTAVSGTHYVGSSGEIIFNPDEINKEIKIQISNSADNADDLRFTVELNYDGLFNPTPMTISLKKIGNFYSDEMMVLHNLPCSLPFSISDIKSALDICLNSRTFHMALTHLCSTNNATDVQIALAFELGSLCLRKLRGDTILNVFTDFFRMDNFDF